MDLKAIGSYSWSVRAKRQHRLLGVSLEQKSNRQLSDAQEETAPQQDPKVEVQNHATLSDDLLFRIFISLPDEDIVKLQFVCKRWLSLINSSLFITCHGQKSDTVLIRRTLTLCHPPIPPGSGRLWPHEIVGKWTCRFDLLDFTRRDSNSIESSIFELVDIRASHDGLVLASTEEKTSLILTNPLTRKHISLPSPVDDTFIVGSYGISFDNEAKTYKVVHLFIEESGYNGAEILSVHAHKWTRIDGPDILIDTSEIPVSLGGSLHWLCWKRGCDYFVSVNVKDEKFVSKKLPGCRADKDRLLNIGGNLGFVTHVENELQVWISIIDSGSSGNWIKKYSIDLGVKAMYYIPICSSRDGKEIVLETRQHKFYVRNLENGIMKRIYSRSVERMDKLYIPHRHTLVSFERSS